MDTKLSGLGKVYEKNAMILRVHVGEVNNGDLRYDMAVIPGDNSPLVYSHQTGKYFHFSWQDILKLAVEAGIDEPDTANAGNEAV